MTIISKNNNETYNVSTKNKKILDTENFTKKKELLNNEIKTNKESTLNIVKNNDINKRHPIITVTGHIDHGKTTFLNYIRKVKNPPLEHGGITQYIKAYKIDTPYGYMTFLDTPGHFAFNSIRKNSIQYTDIVLLIIALDDGIKPQTIESIETAKKFNIPIVVAINKIDKIDKLEEKTEKIIIDLTKHHLLPEKWGGDTLMSFISAKTGEGIDELITLLNLQAEMMDLKFSKNDPVNGIILDNKIDIGKGFITTLIVLNGVLKKGDTIQIKDKYGKVKTIFESETKNIDTAYPSNPVYITGLPNPIPIGEKFQIIKNEKELKKIKPEQKINKAYNLDDIINKMTKPDIIKINIIVKADVQGSINSIKDSIEKLSTDKCKINLIKIDMGNINLSDINLAINTTSIVIGFNVKYDTKTNKTAQNNFITIKTFNVIYDIINYIEALIEDQSLIKKKETIIGTAEVKKIFKQENLTIAGCLVISGKIKQNSTIKLFRKNIMIHQGTIESLKIFKTNTHEVKFGNECGISIKNYDNIQINDKIKAYI